MEFYTHYFKPITKGEVHLDEGKVEKDGYVSTERRIEEFFAAGERLQMQRKYAYKSPEAVDQEDHGEFQMSYLDANRAAMALSRRIDDNKRRREAENLAKEVAEVMKEDSEVPPPEV